MPGSLALRTWRCNPVLCALGNQPALEMGDGAKDMEDQFTGCSERVNFLLDAQQRNLAMAQHGDGWQKSLQAFAAKKARRPIGVHKRTIADRPATPVQKLP